tara:strand:+ start:272 stop:889 length:618 start_codon:yes stop_codon:yes gene_type:complete
MPQSVEDKVVARIYGNGRGWSFSPKDFLDLGTRKSVDMSLIRLTNKTTIRRVIRGVYDYPRYSELLQQKMGPDTHQVATALARKFGWRIQPSGAAASNLIGLSTQVPSQYIYKSDGPDRSYQIENTSLQFRHGALKETGFKNDESGLIVQALKAMSEEHVNDETIQIVRNWLPAEKRSRVLKDTERVTGWVYATIKKICQEKTGG